MKDLNRNEVYDLRGITHEQAEELLQWLIENDTNWGKEHEDDLDGDNPLYYCFESKEWIPDYCGISTTTTHISTLFEQSYEEQLIEAMKRVEILKEKVKQLKEPEVGDVVKAYDSGFVIGFLEEIDEDGDYWVNGMCYHKCRKITQQEVIELLFNK